MTPAEPIIRDGRLIERIKPFEPTNKRKSRGGRTHVKRDRRPQ